MVFRNSCPKGEYEWDGKCYPIDTLQMSKQSPDEYSILIGLDSPHLLPLIAESVLPIGEMVVASNGVGFQVRINSLAHSDAQALKERFSPKNSAA